MVKRIDRPNIEVDPVASAQGEEDANMMTQHRRSLIRLLSPLLLAFLLAPRIASAELTFVGCYPGNQPPGNPHVAMNLWRVSPYGLSERRGRNRNLHG